MTFDTMGLSEVKLEDGTRGLGLDTRSEIDPEKGTEGSLAACTTVGCTRAPSSATRRQVSLVPVKKVHSRRWPFATKTRRRTHCRKKNASGYPPTPDVHVPPRRSREFLSSDVKQETVDMNHLNLCAVFLQIRMPTGQSDGVIGTAPRGDFETCFVEVESDAFTGC